MRSRRNPGITTIRRRRVFVEPKCSVPRACVAMSRGRETNSLYLTNPQHQDEQCTHLTHHDRHDALDRLTATLNRGSAQIAAIDHAGPAPTDDIDPLDPPPSRMSLLGSPGRSPNAKPNETRPNGKPPASTSPPAANHNHGT